TRTAYWNGIGFRGRCVRQDTRREAPAAKEFTPLCYERSGGVWHEYSAPGRKDMQPHYRTRIAWVWAILAAVCSLGVVGPVAAQPLYATGSEAPQLAPGPLPGQNGWNNDGGPPQAVTVQAAVAQAGTAAVAIDATGNQDGLAYVFLPLAYDTTTH